MSTSSLFLEDFGQKVDLTRRIREVMLNYPEGTTVLKELIQNADDAGARAVKLCLDRRSHGCGHVLCRRCSSAVSRCPFCRVQVSKAMKIFRP